MSTEVKLAPEELYAKNIAFFEKNIPTIHNMIKNHDTVLSTLVPVGEDDWDVELRGVRLYGQGVRAALDGHLNNPSYWTRISTSAPGENSTDAHSGLFKDALLERVKAEGVAIGTDWYDNDAFYLVSFGVGLGLHLRPLVEKTRCRALILVEPNTEFLIHSLSVLDWEELVTFCQERSTSLYWVVSDRDLIIANEIQTLIRFITVAEVDGMTLFTLYHNAHMASARAIILREAGVLLSGLGWLDDELLMVRNSVLNLRDERPLIFRKAVDYCDWPVFVVGSGPSLENDLDAIAANAHKAVVIACGTGLAPLLRRGIRPDFYMELENLPQSYVFLDSIRQKYSLEGITLVGTTTIDPRIAPLFDRVVYFLRDGLASSPLFTVDRETDLPWVNPTVGNTGLAYGLGAGFREFYLFGIDLGAKDPKKHHCDDTPYMTGLLPFENPMNDMLPGNFGGTVYADSVFRWAHDSFEKVVAIKQHGHRFYNCADGAMIKGTIPKMSSSLKLPERAEPKAAMIDRLLSRYQPYGRDTLDRVWQPEEHFAEVAAFRDVLLDFCAEENAEHPDDYVAKVFRHMFPFGPTRPPHHYFRGSMALAMLCACHFRNRVQPDQREQFRAIMRQEFVALINRINDRVVELLSDLPEEGEGDHA